MVLCCSTLAAMKPNILFIAVDDLKPMLGCYGDTDVLTPNIDQLAARGTVFLNNACQQSVCGPSRASLMTGTYPDTTKVYDLKTMLPAANPDTLTLPEYLRTHGYETTGTGKIYDPRSVDDELDAPSWSQPFQLNDLDPYFAPGFKKPKGGYFDPEVAQENKQLRQYMKKEGIKRKDKQAYAAALSKFPNVKPLTECMDVLDDAYDDGAIANCAVDQMASLSKGGATVLSGGRF